MPTPKIEVLKDDGVKLPMIKERQKRGERIQSESAVVRAPARKRQGNLINGCPKILSPRLKFRKVPRAGMRDYLTNPIATAAE